jgi:acetoin utilization protein AcuB
MNSIPSIKALMTPFPYSIDAAAPVEEAHRRMREHGIRHLPVKSEGSLAGVVSDREIRLALETGRSAAEVPMAIEAVTAEAYVVDVNEPLDNVLLAMAEKHIVRSASARLVPPPGRRRGRLTAAAAPHIQRRSA